MVEEIRHTSINPNKSDPVMFRNENIGVSIMSLGKHLYETYNMYEHFEKKGETIKVYIGGDNTPVREIRSYILDGVQYYMVILDLDFINSTIIREVFNIINDEFGEELVYLGRGT